jgi:hypothetical protein
MDDKIPALTKEQIRILTAGEHVGSFDFGGCVGEILKCWVDSKYVLAVLWGSAPPAHIHRQVAQMVEAKAKEMGLPNTFIHVIALGEDSKTVTNLLRASFPETHPVSGLN